jgi:HEAT repeat protein
MNRIAPVLIAFAAMTGIARSQPTSASVDYTPPKLIGGEDMESWIKKLNHSDPGIRVTAVRCVPMFGKDAAKAIPKMVDLILDRDTSVRLAAVDVLSSNGVDDPKQLKEMFGYLNDNYLYSPQTSLRTQGAFAIGRMAPLLISAFSKDIAEKTIPRLLSEYQLRYPGSFELRKAAAFALGRVAYSPDGSDTRAIVALIRALNDDSLAVRVEATQSLILLGPPSDAGSILKEKKILSDKMVVEKNNVQRIWLRLAFMRLDVKEVTAKNLEPVAKALDDSDPLVRSAAAQALGMMGKSASTVAGNLRAGLKFEKSEKPEDLDFLIKCLWAIGQMGTDAGFMMNDVKPLTQHKNEQIRKIAQDTLDSLQGKKKANAP